MKATLLLAVLLLTTLTALPIASAAITEPDTSGGTDISADTAADATTPAWTDLDTMTIAEEVATDIGVGDDKTLVLKAPAGFEFNPASVPSISGIAADITALSLVLTATEITITMSVGATSTSDTILIGASPAIQVRPTTGVLSADGQIYRPSTLGGDVVIAGITATDDVDGDPGGSATNFGTLGMVFGTLTQISVQPVDDNNGDESDGNPITTVVAGEAFGVRLTLQDQHGNTVTDYGDATVDVKWSSTAGVAPDGTTITVPAESAISLADGVDEIAGFTLNKVESGVTITVELDADQDDTFDDPVASTDSSALFVDGINLDSKGYRTGETVTVTVGDEDKAIDPQLREIVSITAMSATIDPIEIIVALRETGVATSIFSGTFALVGVTPGVGELLVSTGDLITVEYLYDDPNFWTVLEINVDNTAPVVEITAPVDGAFVSGATVEIAATHEDGADISIKIGAEEILDSLGESTPVSVDWDTTEDGGLKWFDGTYTITVTSTDAAGNIGSDSITVTVDNTSPEASNHEPAGGSYISDTTPTISFDVTDLGSGVDESTVGLTIDGQAATPLVITEITNGFNVEYSIPLVDELSEGVVTIVISALDDEDVANVLTMEIPITGERVGLGTGLETGFNLVYEPVTDSETTIYVDGRPQVDPSDYGISGTAITFTGGSIPANLAVITADYETETWEFNIDLTPPTMTSAEADTKTVVKVTFGEELDPETVDTTDFLVDGVIPSNVEVTLDRENVKLTVATMPTDDTPTVILTGNGVADLAGNFLTEGELTATDKIEPEVSVTVSPDPTTIYATSGVKTIFTLTFSELMNTGTDPTVSYGKQVTGEIVGITDESGDLATTPLDNVPIVVGSLTLHDGTNTFTDNGDGSLTGTPTGTAAINYVNGEISALSGAITATITADYIIANTIPGNWISGIVWKAEYPGIPLITSDGTNYVSISDAVDIAVITMKADNSNTFKIDTEVDFDTFSPATDDLVYRNNPIVVITFNEVVTITDATFDEADALVHEDILADLTTTDYKTYRLATSGLTHDEDYTITVSAEDALGNELTDESATFIISLSVDIELVEGWNLISLPLIPEDSSIEVILADILDNVNIVYGYEADAWSTYLPAVPDFATLTDIEDGKGYWIEMTADDTLTVYGSDLPAPPQVPPVYNVYEGWNLIGFKSRIDMAHETYLSTIPEDIQPNTVIYGWDATSQTYDSVIIGFNDPPVNTELTSGEGYWLYLIGNANIVP